MSNLKGLNEALASFKSCVNQWASGEFELKAKILEKSLANIELVLNSDAQITSIGDTRLLMWEYALRSARVQICAIASDRGIIGSGFGFVYDPSLIEFQKKLIDSGIILKRIFVVSESQYKRFEFFELLRSQLAIGVDVYVVPSNVADYLSSHQEYEQENYVVIDDKLLYRSYLEHGEARNSVNLDTKLILRYQEMFNTLLSRATHFSPHDLPRNFNDL